MPKQPVKIATLSAELSSYSATFTARGLTLAGEQRDDGAYAVTATRTAGGAFVGVGVDVSVKAAVNALAGSLGFPGSPAFP